MRVKQLTGLAMRFIPVVMWMSAMPLFGQFIGIKSVPVASGNQFLILPSQTRGLGELSIAIDDPMGDPYRNPAKGIRISQNRMFSSPVFYQISGENGSGRTLPLGIALKRGDWYGGGAVAFQQISASEQNEPPVIFTIADGRANIRNSHTLRDKNRLNWYGVGFVGKKLSDRFSAGAGISWAGLDAVDGVEFLYGGSQNIEQTGHQLDLRVGLLGEWPGDRTVEAVLLHRNFDMTHDVTYLRWRWDDFSGNSIPVAETERNLDRTRTWGLHLGYSRPIGRRGWKGGSIFTVNRKSHPKIPNYALMNIPRDPGNTWAFNLGMGFSRQGNAGDVVGFELIFEPIWSNTWADAATTIITPDDRIIPRGAKTVNNDFSFTNWIIRFGVGHQTPAKTFGFQLGMQVYIIQYWLDQTNFIEKFKRSQRERWAEWTPSLGLVWKFEQLELRYTGLITFGTGRPGLSGGLVSTDAAAGRTSDVILAPAGQLALASAHTITHQVMVAIPLGN